MQTVGDMSEPSNSRTQLRNHDFLCFILQLALHYCNLGQKPNWRIYGYLWNLTFRLLKLKTGIKHKGEVMIPTNSSFAKNAASGIIIVGIAEQRDADQTNAPKK